MDLLTNVLMQVIACEIFGTEPDFPLQETITDELLPELYNLSQKHDLAHLAGYILDKNNLLPISTVSDKFREQFMAAVFRYERLEFDYGSICSELEKAEISFIPLKGSVLKKLYPEPWMRTSCDIDILVHPDDVENSKNLFEAKLQFTAASSGLHDITFLTPNNNPVELHFDLIENSRAKDSAKVLGKVWDYSYKKEENGSFHIMNDEMFLLYHIAHMAKHFESGGCGVRSVLDLGILLRKPDLWNPNSEKLLSDAGLLVFAKAVRGLCEAWFFGKEHNSTTLKLQEYIVGAGAFGTKSNAFAVRQGKEKSKLKYIFSRIFLPYEALTVQYPILRKKAYLTPFYEICRWFKLLFGKDSGKRKNNLGVVKNTSEKDINEISELINLIGLR